MEPEIIDITSSSDEDGTEIFGQNITAANNGEEKKKLSKKISCSEITMQPCKSWKDVKISRDIDSFVVVCRSLKPYVPSYKFNLNIKSFQISKCQNVKITDHYIRDNIQLQMKVKENDQVLRFFDAKLGGAFPLNLYCLFIVKQYKGADLRLNLANDFLQIVVKPALLSLPPSTVTRKNCGEIFAPVQEMGTINVFHADWEAFADNFQRNLQIFVADKDIVDVLIYQAIHGLKCKDVSLLSWNLLNSIRYKHEDVLFFQVHLAVTLEPLQPNHGIVGKIDVMKKILERESDENKRPLIHQKYFLDGYGHLSNAAHPYKLDNIDYVQIYDTSSHLVHDHSNRNNVFPFVLAGGFKCDFKDFKNYIHASESRLQTYHEYAKSVGSSHDLRIEVVITTNDPGDLVDDFFDRDLESFKILSEEAERKLTSVRSYYFFRLLQELLDLEAIVLASHWQTHCNNTIGLLLNELTNLCNKTKESTDYFDKKKYILTHATETLIMYWMEGNEMRLNAEMLKKLSMCDYKSNIKNFKNFVAALDNDFALSPSDVKIGYTQQELISQYLVFIFDLSYNHMDPKSDHYLQKLSQILMKRLAQGYLFILNDNVLTSQAVEVEELKFFKNKKASNEVFTAVTSQKDIIRVIKKPQHPLVAIIHCWVMRLVPECDRAEFFDELSIFVENNVKSFPRILMTGMRIDLNYWASVVKDPEGVINLETRSYIINISGKIVQLSNLKQYKDKAQKLVAMELAKQNIQDAKKRKTMEKDQK